MFNCLKALKELPFGVGKNLLSDFLQGKEDNDSIKKNELYKLETFGSLLYSHDEILSLLDKLLLNNLVKQVHLNGNKYIKILKRT